MIPNPPDLYRRHRPKQTGLYPVIETNLTPSIEHLHEREAAPPHFVTDEFKDYATDGFIRFKCDGCRSRPTRHQASPECTETTSISDGSGLSCGRNEPWDKLGDRTEACRFAGDEERDSPEPGFLDAGLIVDALLAQVTHRLAPLEQPLAAPFIGSGATEKIHLMEHHRMCSPRRRACWCGSRNSTSRRS